MQQVHANLHRMARKSKNYIAQLTPQKAKVIYLERLADLYTLRDALNRAIKSGLNPDTCTAESWTKAGLPGEPVSRLAFKLKNDDLAELAARGGVTHETLKLDGPTSE